MKNKFAYIFMLTIVLLALSSFSCGEKSITELNATAKPGEYYENVGQITGAFSSSGIDCTQIASESSTFETSCLMTSGNKESVIIKCYSREWSRQMNPYQGTQGLPGIPGEIAEAANQTSENNYEETVKGTIDQTVNYQKEYRKKFSKDETYFLVGPDWTIQSDLDTLKKVQSALGGEIR
jgi:hypothetical protein